MGYFRLWLAVWVMVAHFGLPGGWTVNAGAPSVRAFFVLSGFVIALVLEKRYAGRLKQYALLRCLRIYPAYLAMLAAGTLAWTVVASQGRGPVALWHQAGLTWLQQLGMVLQQVLLVGMECTQNLVVNGQVLAHYTVLPHAWSLSVELCFYLSAPWIVRWSSPTLLGLALFTLVLHAIDPSTELCPPSLLIEVGYFSLGVLGWRWQQHWPEQRKWLWAAVVAGLALYVVLPQGMALAHFEAGTALAWQNLVLPLIAAALAPCLYKLGKDWSGDRAAGEISYSLYLVHPLSGLGVAMVLHGAGAWPRLAGLILGSLAAAWVFWRVVDKPVEQWRARIAA